MAKRERLVGPDGRRDVAKLRELDTLWRQERAERNIARGLPPDTPHKRFCGPDGRRDVDKLRKLLEEPPRRDVDPATD